jgi:hypothetical protein
MKAHKALYKIGKPAIPEIREALFQLNLSRFKHPVRLRYVTALVSLIHDIDETETERIAYKLAQDRCDEIILQRVKSISEFTVEDYIKYQIKGVNIFESKRLVTKQKVRPFLQKWLKKVPEKDLKEIERLYLLHRAERVYKGYYMPIFYNVGLVWDNPYANFNPISWLSLLFTELTLYHEIGHHAYRHSFGQDMKQEEEADEYAVRIFLSSRPTFCKILLASRKIVRFFK